MLPEPHREHTEWPGHSRPTCGPTQGPAGAHRTHRGLPIATGPFQLTKAARDRRNHQLREPGASGEIPLTTAGGGPLVFTRGYWRTNRLYTNYVTIHNTTTSEQPDCCRQRLNIMTAVPNRGIAGPHHSDESARPACRPPEGRAGTGQLELPGRTTGGHEHAAGFCQTPLAPPVYRHRRTCPRPAGAAAHRCIGTTGAGATGNTGRTCPGPTDGATGEPLEPPGAPGEAHSRSRGDPAGWRLAPASDSQDPRESQVIPGTRGACCREASQEKRTNRHPAATISST